VPAWRSGKYQVPSSKFVQNMGLSSGDALLGDTLSCFRSLVLVIMIVILIALPLRRASLSNPKLDHD